MFQQCKFLLVPAESEYIGFSTLQPFANFNTLMLVSIIHRPEDGVFWCLLNPMPDGFGIWLLQQVHIDYIFLLNVFFQHHENKIQESTRRYSLSARKWTSEEG